MALTLLGKLLCSLGFHDFHVISRAFEFRAGATVEKAKIRPQYFALKVYPLTAHIGGICDVST